MIRHNGIEISLVSRTIWHRKHVRRFNAGPHSVEFEIWCLLLLGGGQNRWQIFDSVYGDDPEGGPDSGPHMIDVRIQQFKKKFAAMEFHLVKDRRASRTYWRLEPIPVFNVQQTADRILAHVV